MKLTATIAYLAIVSSLLLSSCTNEIVNTFASSVQTSECSNYKLYKPNLSPDYAPFYMSISNGKADCLLSNIGVQCGFDEVIVEVSKSSQNLVKVILKYNYSYDLDCGTCYHNVSFTLEDLPNENFIIEVYTAYYMDDSTFHYKYDWRYDHPHLREMIRLNNPENSNLQFYFKRNPDQG